MPDYRVQAVCNGVTVEASASTPTPIGVAPNPTRAVDLSSPTITGTTALSAGTTATAYTATLNVVGGVPAYTWALVSGTLPTGLTLSTAGVLSGTPTVVQFTSFTVSVTDGLGRAATKAFTLAVTSSLPAASAFGSHLGDWMVQAGDQVIYVADGSTLDGANVNLAASAHASTTGVYNGWLVIACQTAGGSTIDLSDPGSGTYRGGLDLRYNGTAHGFTKLGLRIMLVGFNIKWGGVAPEWVQYLRTWYCDFTWSDTVWQSHYDTLYFAAHGSHPSPSPTTSFDSSVFGTSLNWKPTMIGMDQCDKIEMYFSDWHNIGDDAIYATSTNSLYTRGCRFDDIYHHGTNYLNPATGGDLIHSDCLQLAGVGWNFKNCSFGGHLDIEGTGAGGVGMTGDNFWQYGSSIPGFGFGTDGSHFVTGAVTNGKWFGNGQYYHSGVNPATQSVPYYDSSSDRLLDAYDPPGLTWDGSSATSWQAAHKIVPSGVTIKSGSGTAGQNGLITDLATPLPGTYPTVTSAYSNSTNPAVIDKAANSYTSWSTFFNRTLTNNPASGVYGWP